MRKPSYIVSHPDSFPFHKGYTERISIGENLVIGLYHESDPEAKLTKKAINGNRMSNRAIFQKAQAGKLIKINQKKAFKLMEYRS